MPAAPLCGTVGCVGKRSAAMDLQCELCPRQCRIPPGGRGICRIRVHLDDGCRR